MRPLPKFRSVGLTVIVATLLSGCLQPAEQRPGLRLSGEVVESTTDDWSFVQPRQQIFVETRPWYRIPHSVTTISIVHNGTLYVPSRDPDTKSWPKNVARDPRVRLKIGESIYERKAVLITDPEQTRRVLRVPAGDPLPNVAIYRIDPRD